MKKHRGILITLAVVSSLQIFGFRSALAAPRRPGPPLPELVGVSFSERFDAPYTNGATAAEVVVSGMGTLRESWSGYSLERVGEVVPFLIPGVDGRGHTNLTGASGAIRLWVKPYWSSANTGTNSGPGHVAQLLEMSVVGAEQSVPVWSLQVSASGSEISLVAAGEPASVVLLQAEIAWQAGEWHQVILNRSEQGTALILDGEIVAAGSEVLAVPPAVAALAVGSRLVGTESIEGEIEEVYCFVRPLNLAFHYLPYKELAARGPISAAEAQALAELRAQRMAERELREKQEAESPAPMMLRMSGPSADCVTNGPVYLTNVVVNVTTNDGWTVFLDIAGGTNGIPYDIFSTPELAGNDVTNSVWTWLETGMTCETHYFTNQATNQMFYILTVPGADRDGDSLYDGWEWKHFGTLAQTADGDFDGDGWSNLSEYQNGTDPNTLLFMAHFGYQQFNTTQATGQIEVMHGSPAYAAVLVDDPDVSHAVWMPYAEMVPFTLGLTFSCRGIVWTN